MSPYLLDGLRVIDTASFIAGPVATTMLADFGAAVIKIEPPAGDPYRHRTGGPGIPESPFNYRWIVDNRTKRALSLDLRRPEGREGRSWEECVRIGELLADETLRIVQGAAEQTEPKLFCAARSVTFPVDSPLMRELVKVLPGAEGVDGKLVTQMNLLNLGDAQILSIPGEALPNIGYYQIGRAHV